MHKLLEKIFSSKLVMDKDGTAHQLNSHTGEEQCEFLQELVNEVKPTHSLEVGLAYGISAVAILDALQKLNHPFHHIVIDPFQDSWKNIGLLNIERAGFADHVTFYQKFSDQVIPALYYENYKIQFAYIDSTKVFDVLMTDVYFITKILGVGGILVMDDCGFPGIRSLVRFLSQHPAYKIRKGFGKDKFSSKREFIRSIYFSCLNLIPFKKRILANYNFKKDEQLGVNYSCIAFQKISEDERNWDWHCSI